MLSKLLGLNLKPNQQNKVFKRLYFKLNFSPKFRRETKKEAMAMYLRSGKVWNEGVLSEDSDPADRSLIVNLSSMIGKLLRLINRIEENIKYKKVKKRRFSVYLHKSKKKVLIELRFFHIIDLKKRMCSFLIFEKWGKDNKTGGVRYDRRLSKSGYRIIDSGSYSRKNTGWEKIRFIFRGKKRRMEIKIKYTTRESCRFYLENKKEFPFFNK